MKIFILLYLDHRKKYHFEQVNFKMYGITSSSSDYGSDDDEGDSFWRRRCAVATKRASRYKSLLDKRMAAEATFREKLGVVEEKLLAKDDAAASAAEKVKELEYANKLLSADLAREKKRVRDAKLKSNARLVGLSEALSDMEEELARRSAETRRALRDIQDAVSDLQRHIGSRGYHAVPSETARRLLSGLWETVGSLAAAVQCDVRELPASPSKSPSPALSKASRAAWTVGVRDGSLSVVSGTAPVRDIAKTMSDTCAQLETENVRLQSAVEELRASLAASQSADRAEALIPKYRAAIVKSRSISESLRKQVGYLEDDRRKDREKIAALVDRCELAESRGSASSHLEAENDRLMSALRSARKDAAEYESKWKRAAAQSAETIAQVERLLRRQNAVQGVIRELKRDHPPVVEDFNDDFDDGDDDGEVAALKSDLASLDDAIHQLQRAIKGAMK